MAQSSALRQIGPALSRLQLNTMAPLLLVAPKVGRSPVTPQRVDGDIIEPHVSVPMAKGNSPAAVAAAEPAEEPLDPCFRFQGLLVRPPNQRSLNARAPKDSLAQSTAPALVSCSNTKALS